VRRRELIGELSLRRTAIDTGLAGWGPEVLAHWLKSEPGLSEGAVGLATRAAELDPNDAGWLCGA
jgi:hypothetical protein